MISRQNCKSSDKFSSFSISFFPLLMILQIVSCFSLQFSLFVSVCFLQQLSFQKHQSKLPLAFFRLQAQPSHSVYCSCCTRRLSIFLNSRYGTLAGARVVRPRSYPLPARVSGWVDAACVLTTAVAKVLTNMSGLNNEIPIVIILDVHNVT